MAVEIIILAAGQGTRMRSTLPKVLHPVGGKPLLQHILETTIAIEPKAVHVVVGHGRDQVMETINTLDLTAGTETTLNWVEQSQQLGTGHAVMQAMPAIDPGSTAMILNGDTPLIKKETLSRMCNLDSGLNLLTVEVENPFGLGRILRNEKGDITGIIEHKDASEEQRKICEINTNCMAGNAGQMNRWLQNIENQNAQNEYYLTDMIGSAVSEGSQVNGLSPESFEEILGINSRIELCQVERIYQRYQVEKLMADGVTLMDSSRVDIRGQCDFGIDCAVDINVVFEGRVTVGDHCRIGPNTVIKNSVIGDHCIIEANSVIEDAVIGDQCNIGPFARMRPGTRTSDGVRIGNFVETKASQIGEKSKINHLSYVGDSVVGKDVNIGAGVITCNYDGANKHQTVIGDNAFIGSDSQLVAPVEIGEGATVGAGSTITTKVADKALAISRGKQKAIPDWKRPVKK